MRRRMSQASLSLALLAAACGSGPKLEFEYDHDADFAGYRTYSWKESDARALPVIRDCIVRSVDGELAKKGLKRTDGEPDANVTYHGGTSDETVVDTDVYGYNPGPGWYQGGAPAGTTSTVTRYTKGTLIVDLWDAHTKRLIWRGIATDIVTDDPAVRAEKVRVAVEKMFVDYPPAHGK